jgi:hypothetical protein
MSSLEQQVSPQDEVILVDNGSDDGSVEYVRRNFPFVRIVENGRNLGFAEGNNVGLRSAVGDYVIILNNDTQVSPNFLEVLVKCASSDPEIGSVGCRIIQEDGTFRYGPSFTNMAFIVPLFMGNNFLPERIGRLFRLDEWCATNCATATLYAKRALKVTGGFEADFWSDWEDHDLGLRLWLAGYKNLYTTKTYVIHVGGGSFGSVLSKQRYVRIIRNMLFTYIKNYEAASLVTYFFLLFWLILPIRHILLMIAYEMTRIKGKSPRGATHGLRDVYGALPEAYMCFLRGLSTIIRKRAMVQTLRKVSDSAIFRATRKNWII